MIFQGTYFMTLTLKWTWNPQVTDVFWKSLIYFIFVLKQKKFLNPLFPRMIFQGTYFMTLTLTWTWNPQIEADLKKGLIYCILILKQNFFIRPLFLRMIFQGTLTQKWTWNLYVKIYETFFLSFSYLVPNKKI
jgi:hypothetical protein